MNKSQSSHSASYPGHNAVVSHIDDIVWRFIHLFCLPKERFVPQS